MNLMLNDDELVLLRGLLQRDLADLRAEIGKTENFNMRQDLKRDEERLKSIIARVA
jgi:hypothetical protein